MDSLVQGEEGRGIVGGVKGSVLLERLGEEASRIGFDLFGVSAARRSPRADAVRRWLGEGMHAGMDWMTRDPERRLDPARVVDGARSVISVGLMYYCEDPPDEVWEDPLRGRVARYAWGKDYHDVVKPMLMDLGRWLEGVAGEGMAWRAYVDTGPVLEREVAERAGLGFVGKNTLLIHPLAGSYFVLGEIVTALDFGLEAEEVRPDAGTCGGCRRCLDVCPTHAFPAPYILDSRLCISYLTIEHRGSIPEALREKMGRWVFGCDACQTICPWVRSHRKAATSVRFTRFDPERCAPRLDELMALTPASFAERFRGMPVKRAKRSGLRRNAAVALGNSGHSEARACLEQYINDADPVVREHVLWALDH